MEGINVFNDCIRKLIFVWTLCSLLSDGSAQTSNPLFDSTLAKKYQADQYGMRNYTMVLLKTGPVQIDDKAKVSELFRGHLDNIGRLVKEGKMVVAGPFMKNDLYRGIFILTVATAEEAKTLMDTDPAIHAGLLEPVYLGWYGSAALPAYLELSEKLGRFKI